jgi:hypothetical protein
LRRDKPTKQPLDKHNIGAYGLVLKNGDAIAPSPSSRAGAHLINFSFYAWSSPNNLLLLGVVVPWIDEVGQKHNALVGLRTIEGEHLGENMAGEVWKTIEDLWIAHKIGYFTALRSLQTNLQAPRISGNRALTTMHGPHHKPHHHEDSVWNCRRSMWRNQRELLGKLSNVIAYGRVKSGSEPPLFPHGALDRLSPPPPQHLVRC